MATSRKFKFKYGWKPDLPDHRDLYYVRHEGVGAPPILDLSPNFSKPYDQGQLGSCTANAIAGAMQSEDIKNKTAYATMIPSRLFIYYNERSIEGTVSQDSGAEIRDGFKSIASQGACDEKLWWYNVAKFTAKPNKTCYADALKHKAITYLRVNQDLTDIKACLVAGFPIVFGISVYDSFESDAAAKNGVIPMPAPNEENLGGHAIVIVGYDDTKKLFKFRNSWGTSWGDKGYGYLPYAYVLSSDLASDFWTIRKLSA